MALYTNGLMEESYVIDTADTLAYIGRRKMLFVDKNLQL